MLAVFNEFNWKNGPKSAFPQSVSIRGQPPMGLANYKRHQAAYMNHCQQYLYSQGAHYLHDSGNMPLCLFNPFLVSQQLQPILLFQQEVQ